MSFTNIRVFFNKIGNAKYISHLDLYRAFGRAIRRCRLPVWITEGFNPHIYMTFALPLALGIEGLGESADFRFTEEVDFTETVKTFNTVMPCGIDVVSVAAPIRKADEIQKARYEIYTEQPAKLNEYLSQPEIKIEKRTKKGILVIDVKPLFEWNDGVLTLPAGNDLNINPWNVLNGFEVTKVIRNAILCKDGELFK